MAVERIPGEHPDDNDVVTEAFVTASSVLDGVAARSVARTGRPVTPVQLHVLTEVHAHGPTLARLLAGRLGVPGVQVAKAIHQLAGAGLVQDVLGDGVPVALTGLGRRLVESLTDGRRREFARILDAMPAVERAMLVEAVTALNQVDRWYAPDAGEDLQGRGDHGGAPARR